MMHLIRKTGAGRWLLACLLLAALLAAGCGPATQTLTMVTGGAAGTYYPIGQAMAAVITDNVGGAEVTAQTSEGSVANARSLDSGEAELALIENTIAYYAYEGVQMFAGEAVSDIRGIATLYPEMVQIVTLKEYAITEIGDLAGKRVGIGAPGSGTAVHMLAILAAAGLDETRLDIQYLDFAECVAGLQDRSIDAGCIVAGIPTAAVTDIAASADIAIVSVPAAIYAALSGQYPFYVTAVIPAGTYEGVAQDTTTVAVRAMLATRADVSEDLIYDATKAIFEHTDALAAAHPRGGDITLATALTGMPIPLHPGAEKYFVELGLISP